jgi:hypothetical protein
MNNHKKGKMLERFVGELFVKAGIWKMYYCPPSAYYHNGDVFEMWDLVGITAGESQLVEFIQVKGDLSGYYSFKKKMADWIARNNTKELHAKQTLVWTDKITMRVWTGFSEHKFLIDRTNGVYKLIEQETIS